MSSNSSTENTTSTLDWLEETLIVIKENLAIFPATEYSKVDELVKKYLVHNQKTPENLFDCLNKQNPKRSIDNILLGFSLEHGIETIPNLTKAFLKYQKAANTKDSLGQFFLGRCYDTGTGTFQDQEKAYELYSKAAEAGNALAQNKLALCYANGRGTRKNSEKAFELYSKAAEAGHLKAQYNLALCYANGEGMTKNSEKAFELYSKAAKAGHLDAQSSLADCYLNERGTTKDSEKAFKLYSKAADAEHLNAQNSLAVCYYKGEGTMRNSEKAFELYSIAAEAGDLNAQNNLAVCYDNGRETMRNSEKALELYSKAAETGHLKAQYNLANCYFNGRGTTKDSEKAFELYSKAADAGHLNAQYNLANCYFNGEGMTKDSEKAFELYSKAAEAGHLEAQLNLANSVEAGYLNAQNSLAICYDNGEGTTRNSEKAFELYSKAAEAGDLNAQNNLALCYINERGMTRNSEKAFELYSKAVKAGHLDAQYSLALCYDNGEGTTKNSEKAFEFYSKAVEAGHLNAQSSFADLGNPSPQISIGTYHRKGWEIVKNLEEVFQFYLKTAEAENQNAQYNLGWCYQNRWGTTKNLHKAFELYLKVAGANNLCYQSDFPDLNVHDLSLEDQNNLEYIILRFQNRGFKYRDNLKGEFLSFEAFFDQLSDEFKCFKCGNLGIIINRSPICPFCDSDKRDDTFKNVIKHQKIRFSVNLVKFHDFTKFGEHGIISPNEIEFLDKVGEGGFGIVKKGSWEIGKILFWEKKSQKYERTGVTKFISHHQSATCKYILECYGITKDITTNEYVMVLPFAEHGDLRTFLKLNNNILTWDMFLRILFQIAGGLGFIHESKLVHGNLHLGNILVLKTNPLKVVIADLRLCRPANYSPQPGEIFGVVRYLAPEICNLSPHTKHTKYSDIYSCAIISWEIVAGERPWNSIKYPISIQLYTIQGKRLPIEKHTPQCIQEIIEKNWDDKPHCRDSAEEFQKRIIAARNNCNLNETIGRKRLNYKTIQGDNHDKSQKILSFTISRNELDLAFGEEFEGGIIKEALEVQTI
ncbi:hypothetical protein G9A89_004052 [Geosiphon pyriformis]|nr:hypothetical protein G9A89_004052 [Geosiphon pyriformis]